MFTQAASATRAGRPSHRLAVVLPDRRGLGGDGPNVHYSDTWQLVFNTGAAIVTFLMVLLIQNTQNPDNAAVQAKLDELIRASKAKKDFIGIENFSEVELDRILQECESHRPEAVRRGEKRADGKHKAKIRSAQTRTTIRAEAGVRRRA